MKKWTVFSNHGHVLICLARNPEARLRDVALDVGITERAVQKIVRDLQDGGMVSITKSGRRNRYQIHHGQPLRHDLHEGSTVKDLLMIVERKPDMPDAVLSGKRPDKRPLSTSFEATQRPDDRLSPVEPPSGLIKSRADGTTAEKPVEQVDQPVESEPDNSTESDIQRQQGSLF